MKGCFLVKEKGSVPVQSICYISKLHYTDKIILQRIVSGKISIKH